MVNTSPRPAVRSAAPLAFESRGGSPVASATLLLLAPPADADECLPDRGVLAEAGYDVIGAPNPEQALSMLTDDEIAGDPPRTRFDALVAVVTPDADRTWPSPETLGDTGHPGLEIVRRIRRSKQLAALPLIVVLRDCASSAVTTALEAGADDAVLAPVEAVELVARVQTRLARPPVPREMLTSDPATGLLTGSQLFDELSREMARGRRVGRDGAIVVIGVAEQAALHERFGGRTDRQLVERLADCLGDDALPLQRLGTDGDHLLILLPEARPTMVRRRLERFTAQVAAGPIAVAGELVRVTPVVGWCAFSDAANADQVFAHSRAALDYAAAALDLRPIEWDRSMVATPLASRLRGSIEPFTKRIRTPVQILATFVIGLVIPFLGYVAMWEAGADISTVVYWVVAVSLLLTAASIWVESLYALDPIRPPGEPPSGYPAASAIVAAYLPNEAATVVETVKELLRSDYPGPFQVILAYNTPRPLPVEEALAELARQDPRFLPFQVPDSTSKAQNVNAALGHVTGEFVGVFDADHHPAPDAFRRAWRWLSAGNDVVQGHCVVRNPDASRVAGTVAVEFESIYAVSHPGRTRLHGFGLFGGSNGFWRTELLARTRMRGSMLTEDIDSTLRILARGARVAVDPALVSRELAPTSLRALWNQRMRWAQGWFQVSIRHLFRSLRSRELSPRQKLGLLYLLGWREVYPWLSLQVLPILAFTAYRNGGVANLHFAVPALVLGTLFTMGVGPAQAWFAWRLAVPELRRRPWLFVRYAFVSAIFYSEFKNVIARVAQLKELLGERHWRVTPREGGS